MALRRKTVGNGSSMLPHLAEALGELDNLAQRRPSLQVPCKVLATLLPELFPVPVAAASLAIDPDKARQQWASGMPILRSTNLVLDDKAFRQRFLAICETLQNQETLESATQPPVPLPMEGKGHNHRPSPLRGEGLGVRGGALARSVREQSLDPISLLEKVLAGQPQAVHAQAEELQLDPSLTPTILRLAALPALARFAQKLDRTLWNQGYCPTCGSWPLLGEFRGLEQIRFLRCGLCASSWEFARLRCPFCGNQDHHRLGYIHVEGEENRWRAATCAACQGYVKMVATLDALSAPQLLVTDLATLHLDLAAADRGFFVP
jgi:hypothetical protein